LSKNRVVILGAGFGGLTAAKELAKYADVTLVDRHNFQTFLPLLYQVSTAGLAADHVAYPVRGALRGSGVKFCLGSPLTIDHKNKSVKIDSGQVLEFDHLVVALGSSTADFGIKGVTEHTYGMKSVHEATSIRASVMRHFEDLCRIDDTTTCELTVVGGGPTGVEMAGALAELVRGPLKRDEPSVSKRMHVRLIEAGPRLLPSFAPKLSARTKQDLEKLGVEVLLDTSVQEVTASTITLGSSEQIVSNVTIWAAGVKGSPVIHALNLPIERERLAVEPTLQVRNHPNIWAIGDVCGALDKDGRVLPMVAPVAIQQGKWIARQIRACMNNSGLEPFVYKDKGSMATIGRHKAVVQVKKFTLAGPLAWLAWLWLHLFYLLGGRNKIGTIADWTWNYLTFDRANRHIIDEL
jgi:NADH:ubiquinone reductase (H+-translocating)